MAFLLRNSLKLSFGKEFLKIYCRPQQQRLKTSSVILNPHKQNPETIQSNDSTNVSKNHKESPKITLIQNQNISVTALEDAKHMAKRRSMHLVKVQDMDAKTQRPVYKLLTAVEFLQFELDDVKKNEKSSNAAAKKSEKSLSIGSRIAEHDLSSRLKNISKWLNKQHEVRILIQATSETDLGNCEKIFKIIEESIKTPQVTGKIVQKRTKGTILKFNILPTDPIINEKSASENQ